MDPTEDYTLLIEWLQERKMSEGEIQLVLDKVRAYDAKTLHDSVMDSIGSGRMTLDALIKQALDE